MCVGGQRDDDLLLLELDLGICVLVDELVGQVDLAFGRDRRIKNAAADGWGLAG